MLQQFEVISLTSAHFLIVVWISDVSGNAQISTAD